MSDVALVLAWLLVWAFGGAMLALLSGNRREYPDGELPWRVGTGFLVGAFVITVWMRLIGHVGLSLSAIAVGLPVALATLAAAGLSSRVRPPSGALRALAGALLGTGIDRASRILWRLLIVWLAFRFAVLLAEVVWRPLFPWDAWTQWATKAHVWFATGALVPFVPGPLWLHSTGQEYFDAAPHYPATVPLWQVWSSLAMNQWDDSHMNLPWWLVGIAIVLLLYGFFRGQRFQQLPALAAAWIVTSLPILNTHIALAGYADLPLAAYLTTAALAGYRWLGNRSRHDAAVALLCTLALPTLKNPGIIWAALLVLGLIVGLDPRRGLRVSLGLLGAVLIGLVVLSRSEPVILGYRLHLQFDFPWRGILDAYFNFANWHLLFFAAPVILVAAHARLFSTAMAPLTIIVLSGFLFLLFGFAFTNVRLWVEDQTTVNRATLHIAPLLSVWLILLLKNVLDEARNSHPGVASRPGSPAEVD